MTNIKYQKKVVPRRYVYHVSYKANRSSILNNGLIGSNCTTIKYRNAIFAHNAITPDYSWFPFCWDVCYDWDFNVKFKNPNLDFAHNLSRYGYDFWQIDTKMLPHEWFVDTPAQDEFLDGSKYPFFIVTFGRIPPGALQLYKLHLEPKVTINNDVANIEGYFRPDEIKKAG